MEDYPNYFERQWAEAYDRDKHFPFKKRVIKQTQDIVGVYGYRNNHIWKPEDFRTAVHFNDAVRTLLVAYSKSDLETSERLTILNVLREARDIEEEPEKANDCLRQASLLEDSGSRQLLAERLEQAGEIVEAAHWNLKLAVDGNGQAKDRLRVIGAKIGTSIRQQTLGGVDVPNVISINRRADENVAPKDSLNSLTCAFGDIQSFLEGKGIPSGIPSCDYTPQFS